MKKINFIIIGIALVTLLTHAENDTRLAHLKDSWLRARERAVTPIDRKYHAELQKLIGMYTKAGNLDAALEARTELTRLHEQMAATEEEKNPKKAEPVEKAILGDWTWFGKKAGGRFMENGVFKHFFDLDQFPAPGSWVKTSDSTVLVTFKDSGRQAVVTFSKDRQKADVKPAENHQGPEFEISKKATQ